MTSDPVDAPLDEIDDEQVAAAIRRLDDLAGQPAAAHVEVFEDVHRLLQESLVGLDGEI